MSTFRGVFTCENCGVEAGAHVGDALACPRPVSQPLSRVVAGPETPALTEAERDALDMCARHENGDGFDGAGWDGEAERFRRRHGRGADVYVTAEGLEDRGLVDAAWDITPAGRVALDANKLTPSACSLIAEVAAFRALPPGQRAALLQIGADGVALLEAARAAAEDPSNRETVIGLRPPVARIDMRVGRECSHCAFVYGTGHVEMPCKHQRRAAERRS